MVYPVKKILWIIILAVMFITVSVLIFDYTATSKIHKIKKFINSDIKITYVYENNFISNEMLELCQKYDLNCKIIEAKKLSKVEKKQIKELINNNDLTSTVSIFNNGKLIETSINVDSQEKLISIFQRLKILPNVLKEQNIIENMNNILSDNNNSYLLHIIYDNEQEYGVQEKILKKISEDNDIEYEQIPAYLLSITQKNKLNNILQISDVKDQIVIAVYNGKIITCIRDIWSSRYKYISALKESGFINNNNFYTSINVDQILSTANNGTSQVITIVSSDCKYCDQLLENMNSIIIDNGLEVYNVSAKDNQKNNLTKILKKLNYDDELTFPLTIIVQNNQLVDYIIGSSTKDTIVDMLTEYGIIKKEGNNE